MSNPIYTRGDPEFETNYPKHVNHLLEQFLGDAECGENVIPSAVKAHGFGVPIEYMRNSCLPGILIRFDGAARVSSTTNSNASSQQPPQDYCVVIGHNCGP
eukprot:PhF_6_TR21076/c0_g2_i2/m.30373